MSRLDEASELFQVPNIGRDLLKSRVHWIIGGSDMNRSQHQTFDLELCQAVDLLLHTWGGETIIYISPQSLWTRSLSGTWSWWKPWEEVKLGHADLSRPKTKDTVSLLLLQGVILFIFLYFLQKGLLGSQSPTEWTSVNDWQWRLRWVLSLTIFWRNSLFHLANTSCFLNTDQFFLWCTKKCP